MSNEQTNKSNGTKWDETAIDNAYEDLLDIVGWILDQAMVSGGQNLFLSSPPLSLFLELMESIETELLIQWKIKRENGLEALFSRQNEWLNQELRNEEGFFAIWYELRNAVWNAIERTNGLLETDAWKRLLIVILTDAHRIKQALGPLKTEYLGAICRLFEQLSKVPPHHLALSFLNLIEIGAHCRPDLLPMGTWVQNGDSKPEPGIIDLFFADSIGAGNWEKVPESLLKFWEKNSGGIYSCFPAFTIEKQASHQFTLRGIKPEKWMDFDQLIGIDENREKLLENTRNFMTNRFAHHVLLWGGRGTGKSSSVLALMKAFHTVGLRLIEIKQQDLEMIPALSDKLRNKPEKFILFCDDLSFDQDSTDYKHLKSILEGSVINPAHNLLLIATANRKDLVFRGELDERYPEQKQLIDEKRAIDDRFGLKLFYEVPVFKDLQKILFASADKTGMPYSQEELLLQFQQFAQFNNHDQPSGRTVFQFISEWQQRTQSQV